MDGLRFVRLDCGLFPIGERERELMVACGATEIIEIPGYDPDQIAAADPDVISIISGYLPRATIERLNHCKMILRLGIGYEKIDTEAAAEKGIVVCNTVGYCVHEVAEHALALMMACARCIPAASASMHDGTWTQVTAGLQMNRVYGKTAGIVGLGGIGSVIAEMLHGMNMRILTSGGHKSDEQLAKQGVERATLEELLRQSDYVFLCCPATPQNYHIIGAEQIAMMKPSAILINTARGQLVDEPALAEALRQHKIRGAGIDVFDHINIWGEVPNPPDGLYHGLDNAILTPHIAYISEESGEELYEVGYAQMKVFLDGGWPSTCVNPQVREKIGR